MSTPGITHACFVCLAVICLGPGNGHIVADVTGEHAKSGTVAGRRVVSVDQEQQGDREWTANGRVDSLPLGLAVHADEDGLSDLKYAVSVTNDGPVIVGTDATFVATLSPNPSISGRDAQKRHRFTWNGRPEYLPQYMFGVYMNCTIQIPFETDLKPGEITINVKVNEINLLGILGKLVGESNSSIQVTDTINGEIMMSSTAYPQCNISNPSCTIPFKTNLTLTAAIHDPSSYFEGALLLYMWNMGNGVKISSKESPDLTYMYPMKGEYNVTVNITALKGQGLRRTGVWWRTVRVLDLKYTVSVTNDGPVIVGSDATFVATLSPTPQKTHNFMWTGPSELDLPQITFCVDSCTIQIKFETDLKPAEMTIKVKVYESGLFGKLVGESTSSIQVTDTINGEIMMSSTAYPQCNISNPSCTIPSKTNLTLTAAIHDPSSYFEGALLLYMWNMGNGVKISSKESPDLTYMYPMKGEYNVTVNITALKGQGLRRTGVWWRTVRVLDAITNLTIESRSSSVQVGNKETVNVTCNGSPPVELCLTVDGPSSEWSNHTNTTCEMVLDDTCHTTLVYHFKSLGEYTFQAAATNNVSFAVSVSTIHAHAPPFPPQSITAITVAIIAGLCMTSIAAVFFIQQVRRSKKRHVEVANFDFQFREHTDSFVKFKTSIFRWKRGTSEEKPLLNKSASNFYSL